MPLSAVPSSVVVLSRETIENSRAENVGDVLRQVPFLFLTRAGGAGGLTTVTLRGGKPNFTLVMLDGIPVNDISDTLGGSFDFAALSTSNVDHIEIVRGQDGKVEEIKEGDLVRKEPEHSHHEG